MLCSHTPLLLLRGEDGSRSSWHQGKQCSVRWHLLLGACVEGCPDQPGLGQYLNIPIDSCQRPNANKFGERKTGRPEVAGPCPGNGLTLVGSSELT